MRRKRSKSFPFLYPFTFLFIFAFLACIGYLELHRPEPQPFSHDPEMEPFDPRPFDLHQLPGDDFTPEPSNPVNPLPSLHPTELFPLARLKAGHHSKIYDLIVVNQIGLDEIDPENGYTLLHYLARSYNLLAMRFLLNHKTYGPDGVNLTSLSGDTPLHLAVTHPNLILALFLSHLLIEKSADPAIPNSKGLTPRDLAALPHVDERILRVIDGEYDPRSEFESETKTFLDFAFGSIGPPKDPHFFK